MPRQLLALKRRMLGVVNQNEVARKLGIRVEHVNRVLNGHRKSRRVCDAIEAMIAERETPSKGVN